MPQEAAGNPAVGTTPSERGTEEPGTSRPSSGTRYTCNQVERSHICYQTTPLPSLVPGNRTGCEAFGTWTAGGECPTEGVIARCDKEINEETRYFYRGLALEAAERACTLFGGVFTASE